MWALYDVTTLCVTTLCVSTLCVTTLCVSTLCVSTMCEHSMCEHSMWAPYVWPLYVWHPLCEHSTCEHSMCGHDVWTLYRSTLCVSTLCVTTLCEHSMCNHSMWALYVWALYVWALYVWARCVSTLCVSTMCEPSIRALCVWALHVWPLYVSTLWAGCCRTPKSTRITTKTWLQFLGQMLQRLKRQKSTSFIVKTPFKSIGEHRKVQELPRKMNIEEVEEPKKHENLQTKPVLDPFKSTADTRKVRELPRKMNVEEVEEPETTKIYRQNPRPTRRPPRKLRKFTDETNMQARNHENSDEIRVPPVRHLDLATRPFTLTVRTPSVTTLFGAENQNQAFFFPPFGPHEISVLIELTLGHLRYHLTDVPPQPNSHLTMSSAQISCQRRQR